MWISVSRRLSPPLSHVFLGLVISAAFAVVLISAFGLTGHVAMTLLSASGRDPLSMAWHIPSWVPVALTSNPVFPALNTGFSALFSAAMILALCLISGSSSRWLSEAFQRACVLTFGAAIAFLCMALGHKFARELGVGVFIPAGIFLVWMLLDALHRIGASAAEMLRDTAPQPTGTDSA